MRWPWTRRPQSREWDVDDTGGAAARLRAERDLEITRAQTQEYEALGRHLREIRERNHLALAFYKAARGKR